jgi:hypothetical protein
MDQATFASWHDFYVTMGTASASLIGLLFVALSLNLDSILGDSRDDLRAFAEQAFYSFSWVLLIAVFFLIPQQNVDYLGAIYLVLGVLASYRLVRRAPTIWRGRRRDRLGEAVFWRFVLPAAAVIGLVAAGFGLLLGDLSALYWLVAVIIGLLMSAARSSWDLLVKVGEERRTAKGVG